MTGRSHVLDSVPGLRELARRQAFLVRREQLAVLGVSAHHVTRQVAARRWREAAPAVIALTTGWYAPEQRLWLAILNAPSAAWLTGLTGLARYGLTGWHRDEVMVLIRKGSHPPRLPGVRYRETRRPPEPPPDLAAGLPCAPVARCAIEAAGTEPSGRTAQGLVIAVVQQRLTTAHELRSVLADTHRIRHRRAIVRALDDAAKGHESLAEADVARLAAAAGLGLLRSQVTGTDGDGHRRRRDFEVDLADGTVLVLQVDGTLHLDVFAIWDDQANDAGAAAEGKLVVRIPALLAREDPERVVAHLTRIRLAAEHRAA